MGKKVVEDLKIEIILLKAKITEYEDMLFKIRNINNIHHDKINDILNSKPR